jgi:hypothetical protein
MLVIKDVIDKMCDTLEEAEYYAKNAHHYKDSYPTLAETYYKLGNEHLAHYMSLHTSVVTLINDYRRTKGEPPVAMAAVWDYKHKEFIEDYEEMSKILQENQFDASIKICNHCAFGDDWE